MSDQLNEGENSSEIASGDTPSEKEPVCDAGSAQTIPVPVIPMPEVTLSSPNLAKFPVVLQTFAKTFGPQINTLLSSPSTYNAWSSMLAASGQNIQQVLSMLHPKIPVPRAPQPSKPKTTRVASVKKQARYTAAIKLPEERVLEPVTPQIDIHPVIEEPRKRRKKKEHVVIPVKVRFNSPKAMMNRNG